MDPVTDSEWLAPMVVGAFSERRYELGLALARLCVEARRMESDRKRMPYLYPPCVHRPNANIDRTDPCDQCQAPCGVPGHPFVSHVCVLGGSAVLHDPEQVHEQVHAPMPESWEAELGGEAAPVSEDDALHVAARTPNRPVSLPEFLRRREAPRAPVVPSARCVAMGTGTRGECHGVLYWDSTEEPAGWMHLDAGILHTPVPDRRMGETL